MTQHVSENDNSGTDIARAVEILRSGGVVGLPTETVYGLGADASNPSAVERVFRIKGRPADHPLIVHVADVEHARRWCREWTGGAQLLAEAFWPGPLTLILERALHVIDQITGGRNSVAIRCPSHPIMHRVLVDLDGGIAAPSANRFGKVSPTTAQHVIDDLGLDVDYVLDGGPCDIGVESTIVDCTVDPPQILRPGGVSESRIIDVLGAVASASGPSRAPGMMLSHYAPNCRVHAVESQREAEEQQVKLSGSSAALDEDGSARADTVVILDASVDPDRFASSMYAQLRKCDRMGVRDVVVVLPKDSGIGSAIRDRIFKAAVRD
ncbi:MAG: L-threonylcarbamoyladenylate synthase [Actinomycetota bacterium]